MADQRGNASPQLLAAQQRLAALQKQAQARRSQTDPPASSGPYGRFSPPPSPTAIVSQLPTHLGWESKTLTAVIRRRQSASNENTNEQPVSTLRRRPETAAAASPPSHEAEQATIKLYPDIAVGLLRESQAAVGRIWLLLRYLDESGQGWIAIEDARRALTQKRSALRVCGWRQLRNLLAQGEGIFWERRNGRIWLRSLTKVARALNVPRLSNHPVALPVKQLTKSMGTVRAHLYASFHSGRAKENKAGQKQAAPIARATIETITNVDPRTQRIYEKRVNVRRRQNFAVGGPATAEQTEKAAWQRGQAFFRLTDYEGKQGPAGKTYLAWQLPNSYVGPHRQQARGQQKRLNRKLTDLFMQGIAGNDQQQIGTAARPPQRFFDQGRRAARAYNRAPSELYWRSRQGNGRYQIWHVIPGTDR